MLEEVKHIIINLIEIPAALIEHLLQEETIYSFYLILPFIVGLACFVIYEVLRIILKQVYR